MGNSESVIPEAPPLVSTQSASTSTEVTSSTAVDAVPKKKEVYIPEEEPPAQAKTLVLVNELKREITYWERDEQYTLAVGETSVALTLPLHVYPAKVATRPSDTPYFYLNEGILICDKINQTDALAATFRSVTGSASVVVENYDTYFRVLVKPSVQLSIPPSA